MFDIRVLELITPNTPWLYDTLHAAISQSAFLSGRLSHLLGEPYVVGK